MSPAGDRGAAGMEPFQGSPAAPIDFAAVPELPVTLEQIAELTGYADAQGFLLVVLRENGGPDVIADTGDPRQVADLLSLLGRRVGASLGNLQ